MPGPALTVDINADTTGLNTALTGAKSGFGSFVSGFAGAVARMGGITGILATAAEAFGKLIELGGPEAQAAMDAVKSKFGDALAPIMEKLVPLIVKLVEGLGTLLDLVLPVLIPALGLFVTALTTVFDWVGFLMDNISKLFAWLWSIWQRIQDLIDQVLKPFQELLDDVASAFDGIVGAIQKATEPLRIISETIAGVLTLVGNLLDGLADIANTPISAPGFRFPWERGGLVGGPEGFSNTSGGSFGGQSITVNTAADTNSVVRALRSYGARNGGARGIRRNVLAQRGY